MNSKNIVLFGAGKSSSFLIKYLIDNAVQHNWHLKIVDQNTAHVQARFKKNPNVSCINANINNENARHLLYTDNCALVISLLPPSLHLIIAQDCILFSKNLITASYVSAELQALHEQAKAKNILFMCEMGLDPGIDHMSAMKIFDNIELQGGIITSFKSHCGGLVAPESDNNSWHYKISWNPRNVVLAGNAGATFLQDDAIVNIPYSQLFTQAPTITVPGVGTLAYYPNRDSMAYKQLYDLKNTHTLIRTTIRFPQFIKAWQYIVAWGLTIETDVFECGALTFENWIAAKLPNENIDELIAGIALEDAESASLLKDLKLNNNEIINLQGTKNSADILQSIIEKSWAMQTTDKDMIVMQHEIGYNLNGVQKNINSSLVVIGEDKTYTAMAKTVGLPMAILAKLLLTNKIENITGVCIPTMPQVYEPVLAELEMHNIHFNEVVF
jgi:saccharopine dehydrogenase-like NADP-dependent oxidoreductase